MIQQAWASLGCRRLVTLESRPEHTDAPDTNDERVGLAELVGLRSRVR